MEDHFPELGRCVSILDRLMRMCCEYALPGLETGWSQQFYVEHLYDHPGASAQEMVVCIRVDKAAHRDFYDALCSDIAGPDIQRTEEVLTKMMENLNRKVWHRMEA